MFRQILGKNRGVGKGVSIFSEFITCFISVTYENKKIDNSVPGCCS